MGCPGERRLGVLAWNNNSSSVLAAGGKSGTIYLHDTRTRAAATTTTAVIGAHTQEVCGLRWSPDGLLLASGGNDNRLAVWDIRRLGSSRSSSRSSSSSSNVSSRPLADFGAHKAAVKAIAWSPHTRGRLVSGGGSSDRRLRFWDVSAAPHMDGKAVDAGSQVCALYWSPRADEIVSTHGFSQNHTKIWNAPLRTPVAALAGHTARILYLAPSPDASTIVTGAPDGRLCFWRLYDNSDPVPFASSAVASSSPLSLSSSSLSSFSSQRSSMSFSFLDGDESDALFLHTPSYR